MTVAIREQAIIPFESWRDKSIPFAGESTSSGLFSKAEPTDSFDDDRDLAEPSATRSGERVAGAVTTAGIAVSHREPTVIPALVAPTDTGGGFNTIRQSIVPLACWRANDVRFNFESSFVRLEIALEIAALKELIDRHTLTDADGQPLFRPPVTVFGHADPTGNDDFNKSLGGRRAQAMYGLLTRKPELWEDLYSHPLGNDIWEPAAIHAIQLALGLPTSDRPPAGARKELFLRYMDQVCAVPDGTGTPAPFKIAPKDFLAGGTDSAGKGDYQGCGEFNPVFLQSQAEIDRFNRLLDGSVEKAAAKSDRDAVNSINRRVLLFLFRPGVHVTPSTWPCPRAKEGSEGCRKRFFSDGESRRNARLPDQPRKFEDTQNTFACRFYHRLSDNSPCERGLSSIRIRLYNPAGIAIPGAPFEVQIGLRPPTPLAPADDKGIAVVQDLEVPNRCIVRWGLPPSNVGEKPKLIFSLSIFLNHENLSESEEVRQKLHNLGYRKENGSLTNIAGFQRDYGALAKPPLQVTGNLNDGGQTIKLLRSVYDECATDLRHTPPS